MIYIFIVYYWTILIMSKGEVQQLKSKIHKLEEEINERTRNYMIRQQYHQHKHHLHYVDR